MAPEQRLALDNERVDRYRFAATSADDHSIYEAEIRPDVWDYANRTFPKLIASGKVFTIRAELGQPFYDDLVMPPDGIPFDIAEDLSADSITAALRGFPSEVLHEWDGRRENPAVLGSYFINRCCLTFPGPFRKWQRSAELEYLSIDPDNSLRAASAWDEPEAAIFDIEFNRYVELIDDPLEQTIVRLDSDGVLDREIAAVLDISEKSVEYRLKKVRLINQARYESERSADSFRDNALVIA